MDDEKTLSDKLSGRLKHPEDAGGKRVLNGKLLRSPVSQGRIVSIELPESPSGLVSIVYRDIPGVGKIKFGAVPVPILSNRNILWKDQPILAAAGPDADELDDWLSRVQLDIKTSGDKETPLITEKLIEKGSPSESFSKAFRLLRNLLKSLRLMIHLIPEQ